MDNYIGEYLRVGNNEIRVDGVWRYDATPTTQLLCAKKVRVSGELKAGTIEDDGTIGVETGTYEEFTSSVVVRPTCYAFVVRLTNRAVRLDDGTLASNYVDLDLNDGVVGPALRGTAWGYDGQAGTLEVLQVFG
ncbi:MAG: hypothetical protein HS108_12295 [Planctomycetes bacterium]|jgi:hypothetical protein|nr:hypothetical protein [Planctomycetota bacterium]